MRHVASDKPILSALALTVAALSIGCDQATLGGPLGGGDASLTAFSRTITVPEFEQAVGGTPVRVEVELVAGQLVAREVEIETADELTDDEEISSSISGISVAGSAGTLTLTLAGGFSASFDQTTEFEGPDDQQFSFAEFVTWAETELADNRQPGVELKRPAPSTPQDPTDQSFLASKIEVDDDGHGDEIELNIDSDNFETVGTPPPDARLTVLGIVIDIDVSSGMTELEHENDDVTGETKFKHNVLSVDPQAGSFTLVNGDVIRIVEGTHVQHSDDGLQTLAAVQAALDQGLGVRAKGKGLLEQSVPRTLVAIKVKFKITDDISLDIFRSAIEAGPVRVEVKLLAGQLVARELEIEESEEMGDEEKIESRITAISGSGDQRMLTLSLGGGFAVQVNQTTEFDGPNDQNFTFDEFVAWVESELGAARQPGVEVERPAPTTPQDPTDPTFVATKLEIEDEVGKDELKLNVDADNFEVLTTPPPDARLMVLGLAIEIDVSNGVTELERDQ